MKRLLARIAVISLGVVAFADSAQADARQCTFDQDTQQIRCVIIADPARDISVRLGDTDLVWRRLGWRIDENIARGIGCLRTVAGVLEIGASYVIALDNVATGQRLMVQSICTFPGQAPPTPPPPPPTLPEFTEAAGTVLIAEASVSPKPQFGGITGLDSWLWCQHPGPVSVTVTLRGWTAVAAVEPVQFGWQVEGTEPTAFTGAGCGSETDPAGVWQPQTTGDWSITMRTTWAGTWTLAYQGLPVGVFPLGPVAADATPIIYPVDEFVGVLVGQP